MSLTIIDPRCQRYVRPHKATPVKLHTFCNTCVSKEKWDLLRGRHLKLMIKTLILEKMSQRESGALLEVFKNKHVEQERELEKRIRECEESRQELRPKDGATIKDDSSTSNLRRKREAARARNQQLLKDLEKSKAILRTESTFTPSEQELRDLAAAYRRFSGLVATRPDAQLKQSRN